MMVLAFSAKSDPHLSLELHIFLVPSVIWVLTHFMLHLGSDHFSYVLDLQNGGRKFGGGDT
jgi:hypothetical protein